MSFTVEVPTAFRAEWPDVTELVRGCWKQVGRDFPQCYLSEN